LAPELKKAIQTAYLASIRVALEQRDAAVDYSLQFGRGLEKGLADRFIGMYVNEDSLSFHGELRQAMDVLKKDFWEPQHVTA
jgi:1,4-dihydroxy-6-naphthoate synthase